MDFKHCWSCLAQHPWKVNYLMWHLPQSANERHIWLQFKDLFLSSFAFQYQKQGKDVEKVKQRLAEIANYVDKVKTVNMLNEWMNE